MKKVADAQANIFTDTNDLARREVPMLGEQSDIRYFAATARSLLNNPKATGMGFWSINPYVGCAFGCAYCYARYAHRYVAERLATAAEIHGGDALPTDSLPPWLAFERRILVKRDAPHLASAALARPAIANALKTQRVVIGTATDPYQPAERRFRITRGILEVFAEQRDVGLTIITKSPLVTRDIDLLSRINERSRLSINVSLITVDRELARTLEPRAPTPEARLRAIARLRAAGIEVGINVMPVLPGITDAPEMIEETVIAVRDANASYVSACALRLQAAARDRYLPFINATFPELAARYRTAYAKSHQVGESYRAGLKTRFARVCAKHGVRFGRVASGSDDESGDEALSTEIATGASEQFELSMP